MMIFYAKTRERKFCRCRGPMEGKEDFMINFEEELKNFEPSLEVEEAEEAIYNHNLTDMTDVLEEMIKEMKHSI